MIVGADLIDEIEWPIFTIVSTLETTQREKYHVGVLLRCRYEVLHSERRAFSYRRKPRRHFNQRILSARNQRLEFYIMGTTSERLMLNEGKMRAARAILWEYDNIAVIIGMF